MTDDLRDLLELLLEQRDEQGHVTPAMVKRLAELDDRDYLHIVNRAGGFIPLSPDGISVQRCPCYRNAICGHHFERINGEYEEVCKGPVVAEIKHSAGANLLMWRGLSKSTEYRPAKVHPDCPYNPKNVREQKHKEEQTEESDIEDDIAELFRGKWN